MKKFKNFLFLFFYIFCFTIVNGCGQTGDLYLPEEANNAIEYNEYNEYKS